MFLPVYYLSLGLSIELLPIMLLKFVKNFECIIRLGVLSTMVFHMLLMFVKNSIMLGITYGLSIATYRPSFNLLQFRLSESSSRARSVSLFSIIIPSVTSIAGPAAGGLIIENFGFKAVFGLAVALYFVALVFFARVEFKRETVGLKVP